jgi:hypothetical protein
VSEFDPVDDYPTPCPDCDEIHDDEFTAYMRQLMPLVAKTLGELATNFDDIFDSVAKICGGDPHKATIVLAALACAHIGSTDYPENVFRHIFDELRKSAKRTNMDETMRQLLRGPRALA